MATRGSETGPVFGHGQLRLYLLAVLAEGPRSGYDVIRGLEDRFGGLYSPSAGTVYPRLAKLEEEDLVTRSDEGRRSTYALTDAGREELERRRPELAQLEESLDESAQRLAEQMRERVRSGTADVRARLEDAARQARARAGGPFGPSGASASAPQDAPRGQGAGSGPSGSTGSSGSASGAAGSAWGGSGPFVPPGFGAGFPFGQGGTPDWATVARWLREFGIAPPSGMSGGRNPWGSWGSAGSAGSAASAGSADPADPSGSSGAPSGSSEPPRDDADDVWAQATDDAGDSAAAGRRGDPRDVWAQATDRPQEWPDHADEPDSDPGGTPESAGRATGPGAPQDTGTGWPGSAQVPHATVPHAPGAPSPTPEEPVTVPESPWQQDDSTGGRRGREWDDFLGGSMPDAAQLREIGEIIRDAATRIQAVLSRPDAGPWRDRQH